MYKQYLNDYERRAEQIRKAAQSVEKTASGTVVVSKPVQDAVKTKSDKTNYEGLSTFLKNFSSDDILLIVLLFLIMNSDEKDISLIIVLGYLFISGL